MDDLAKLINGNISARKSTDTAAISKTSPHTHAYGPSRRVSVKAFDPENRRRVSDIIRMAEIIAMVSVDRNDFMRDVETGGVILSDTDVRALATYYGMTTYISGKRTLLFKIASILFSGIDGGSGSRHLARIIYSGTTSDDVTIQSSIKFRRGFGDDIQSGTVFPVGRSAPFGSPSVIGPGPSPPPENIKALARSRINNGPVLDNNGDILQEWKGRGVIPGVSDRWSNEFRAYYHRLEWAAIMLFVQMLMSSDPGSLSTEQCTDDRCLIGWVQETYDKYRLGEKIYRQIGADGPEDIHFITDIKSFLSRRAIRGGGGVITENRAILHAKGLPSQ